MKQQSDNRARGGMGPPSPSLYTRPHCHCVTPTELCFHNSSTRVLSQLATTHLGRPTPDVPSPCLACPWEGPSLTHFPDQSGQTSGVALGLAGCPVGLRAQLGPRDSWLLLVCISHHQMPFSPLVLRICSLPPGTCAYANTHPLPDREGLPWSPRVMMEVTVALFFALCNFKVL